MILWDYGLFTSLLMYLWTSIPDSSLELARLETRTVECIAIAKDAG